ncbi:MAG: hypothetical protein JO213_15810 [Alphaproteobacteria bacterium]|nr:hypothetical protein [Alphaproteobacteria bacterium]
MQCNSNIAIKFSSDTVVPGEAYLADTPVLQAHAGTQPDLFLRWNAVPRAAEAIDVVVHLHGFSQRGGDMPLAEKVPRSGLDLVRRLRPTLALLPRGNWLRHTYYDFPGLLDGGLDHLIEYGVGRFAEAVGGRGAFGLDRLILTAHSGGGMPAIDAIAGAKEPPDELHVFDGLYGRDPQLGDPLQGLKVIDRWLGERLAREAGRPGALRVVYIERQTGPFSRAIGELITRHLEAAAPILARERARRYRAELSGVPHAYVAAVCGPELLADPAADFDWPRLI